MSAFLSELEIRLVGGDSVWELDFSLKYKSDLLNCEIIVPAGFQTDLASVPWSCIIVIKRCTTFWFVMAAARIIITAKELK